MKLNNLPPVRSNLINVIIETPKGSQNKYVYDEAIELFRLKKTLPMGMAFPFDFGFIPNTTADDGDPLDVLVIMDQHAYPGCLITCRGIGILEAEQSKDGKKERNDRIIAIASSSKLFQDIRSVKELNANMVSEIENFFIDYNKHEGKQFMPLKWRGRKTAYKLIQRQSQYRK